MNDILNKSKNQELFLNLGQKWCSFVELPYLLLMCMQSLAVAVTRHMSTKSVDVSVSVCIVPLQDLSNMTKKNLHVPLCSFTFFLENTLF